MSSPALLLLWSCAAPPLEIDAAATPDGVRIALSRPVREVRLLDSNGQQRLRHALPAPAAELVLPMELPPGRWQVEAGGARSWLTVDPAPPLRLQIQRHPGGPWEDLRGEMEISRVEGSPADVRVGLIRGADGPDHADLPLLGDVPLPVPGQRVVRTLTLAAPLSLATANQTGTLRPAWRPLADLRAALAVDPPAFPADRQGRPDRSRPDWQIRLPSTLWAPLLDRLVPPRARQDREQPWAWIAVPVRNAPPAAPPGTSPDAPATPARDVDLVITVAIEDPAFRPQLREVGVETGSVSVLLRVPAGGEAVAALPVFVDRDAVAEGSYPATLSVRPVGSAAPLHEERREIRVVRGDPVAGVGLLLSALSALLGGIWLSLRLPRILGGRSTQELMTIALFSAALFVVGGATDLLTASVAALLGPFSTLLTGLIGDVGRISLLGALLGLIPRPGVLALTTLCGWLLRGLAMGSFSLLDAFYVGTAVTFSEGLAWISGITRDPAWVDAPRPARWLRLSVAFGGSAALSALTGIWLQAALYRLFYAEWYVALQVLVVGLGYGALAAWIAAGLVQGLREVSP